MQNARPGRLSRKSPNRKDLMPGLTDVTAKLWSDKNGGPTQISYKDVGPAEEAP